MMADAEIPELSKDSDSENSDNWDELEDVDPDDSPPVPCLFCDVSCKNVQEALKHVEIDHKLSFMDLQIKFNLDQYSFIKMVNYIHINKVAPEQILEETSCVWDDEKYLKPADESLIEWLMFDFEEKFNSETAKGANKGTAVVSISQVELNQLRSAIRDLKAEADLWRGVAEDMKKELKANSEKVLSQLEKMDSDPEQRGPEKQRDHVGGRNCSEDEPYFNTYAHYDIHHEMLSDTVRTKSYEEAILGNSSFFAGKTVLDLGCGSGILSMFCSKAGAAQVISIDQSEIIYKAIDILRLNNISNVRPIKGRLEDTEIGVEKVDAIVSEWMGYFLLFEGMMDSLIYARDRHLAEGGKLLPNRCNMSLVAFGDEARHQDLIGFWDEVYGFDMSCMKGEVLRDAVIEVCNPEFILSEANVIADIDLMSATIESCNFSYDFKLKVTKSGRVTSFVGYFDTFFELERPVTFSTGPKATPTHWKQSVFYLKDPVSVEAGQVIEGTLKCRRHVKEVRSLSVTISVFGLINNYAIN